MPARGQAVGGIVQTQSNGHTLKLSSRRDVPRRIAGPDNLGQTLQPLQFIQRSQNSGGDKSRARIVTMHPLDAVGPCSLNCAVVTEWRDAAKKTPPTRPYHADLGIPGRRDFAHPCRASFHTTGPARRSTRAVRRVGGLARYAERVFQKRRISGARRSAQASKARPIQRSLTKGLIRGADCEGCVRLASERRRADR